MRPRRPMPKVRRQNSVSFTEIEGGPWRRRRRRPPSRDSKSRAASGRSSTSDFQKAKSECDSDGGLCHTACGWRATIGRRPSVKANGSRRRNMQDELSTGTAVIQSSGSAHGALDCPEFPSPVGSRSGRAAHLGYSAEVTPVPCSIRGPPEHHRGLNVGQPIPIGPGCKKGMPD